jgi:hypothetical protein
VSQLPRLIDLLANDGNAPHGLARRWRFEGAGLQATLEVPHRVDDGGAGDVGGDRDHRDAEQRQDGRRPAPLAHDAGDLLEDTCERDREDDRPQDEHEERTHDQDTHHEQERDECQPQRDVDGEVENVGARGGRSEFGHRGTSEGAGRA